MLTLIPLSSLEKVFADEQPAAAPVSRFTCLQGEVLAFQLAFSSDCDTTISPVITGTGAGCCTAYWVEDVPVGQACYEDSDEYFLRREPGMYPDVLRPVTAPLQAKPGVWRSLWVEFACDYAAGDYDITVQLGEQSQTFNVTKLPATLPAQTLLYTNWFHCDGLAQFYDVAVWSEEYWAILEKQLRCAHEHGVNFILTPLFTPPLDTQVNGERLTTQLVGVTKIGDVYTFDFALLTRWFDLCKTIGFAAYELSHLYTQWGAAHAPKVVDSTGEKLYGWETDADGAEYMDFLEQFATALLPYLDEQGVKEQCYVHVSDEPCMHHLEIYARHAAFIQRIFSGLKLIDALSDYEFYAQGHIQRPIPANNHIEPFIGNVPELWTYYCCAQSKCGESNRFMAMPGWRNRIIGVQLWKFKCVGFLHWGFNFYNSQFSVYPINPFEVTDAGGGFASGDGFVVYPNKDGETLASTRLKVFREALQDLRALQLLEANIGYDATLALVEDGIAPITFTEYPRTNEWLLGLRERVNAQCNA
ncbi:MAG: DUF4091 domain-containing protein [Oscillospiraceae bacterium]|nr:DUF4091 domain-containing protein [Oscillospiraceae bacterium]